MVNNYDGLGVVTFLKMQVDHLNGSNCHCPFKTTLNTYLEIISLVQACVYETGELHSKDGQGH